MSFRSSNPNFPPLWQTVLAACLGVAIGLLLVNYMDKNRQHGTSMPAQVTAIASSAVDSAMSNISKVAVLPTLERRMNILLMGVDSNGKGCLRFVGTRSDTMMLVSLDPVGKKVGVVSIPRDSRIKLAGAHGIDKINSAHALGGPKLAVDTVVESLGVPVDRHVVIDVQGLRKLFEVLGPVEVVVEKRMHYTDRAAGLHVSLNAGLQQLDPQQAEEYVRFRHDPRGDIGRIERQQWFLRQVSKKLKEPQVILKLPEMFKLANDYVITDLTIDEMARIANFGKDITPQQVQSAILPGRADTIKGGSYWLPDYEACAVVFNRLLGQPPGVTQQLAIDQNPVGYQAAQAASLDHTSLESGRPLSILIRYPRGAEEAVKQFEAAANSAGYRVRYKIRSDVADCQHEQIIQNSYRADDTVISRLRERFPLLDQWPVVLNVESRPITDLAIVFTPTSCPLTSVQVTEATAELHRGAGNTGGPDAASRSDGVSKTQLDASGTGKPARIGI